MLSSSSLDPRAFVDADSPSSPEVVMDVYGSAMSHDLEERDRLSPCSRGSDPCAQRAENNGSSAHQCVILYEYLRSDHEQMAA